MCAPQTCPGGQPWDPLMVSSKNIPCSSKPSIHAQEGLSRYNQCVGLPDHRRPEIVQCGGACVFKHVFFSSAFERLGQNTSPSCCVWHRKIKVPPTDPPNGNPEGTCPFYRNHNPFPIKIIRLNTTQSHHELVYRIYTCLGP